MHSGLWLCGAALSAGAAEALIHERRWSAPLETEAPGRRPAVAAPLSANATAVSLAASNTTLVQGLFQQVEYELNFQAADVRVKDKLVLAIIELLGLGCCGVDRCYMGQTCIGMVKAFTLGGLVIWTLLDYITVIVTIFSLSGSINAMGFRANFASGATTVAAFWFTFIFLCVQCSYGCFIARKRYVLAKQFSEEELVAACLVFDRNGDGRISKDELRLCFQAGLLSKSGGWSEQDVDDFMAQAELDKDGTIDYQQFIRMLSS